MHLQTVSYNFCLNVSSFIIYRTHQPNPGNEKNDSKNAIRDKTSEVLFAWIVYEQYGGIQQSDNTENCQYSSEDPFNIHRDTCKKLMPLKEYFFSYHFLITAIRGIYSTASVRLASFKHAGRFIFW